MIALLHEHCFLFFDTTRLVGDRFQYVRAGGFNDGKWKVRIAAPPNKKGKQIAKDKDADAAKPK